MIRILIKNDFFIRTNMIKHQINKKNDLSYFFIIKNNLLRKQLFKKQIKKLNMKKLCIKLKKIK